MLVKDILSALPFQAKSCDIADFANRDDHYGALQKLFENLAPTSVFEIGSLIGYSLVTMWCAAPQIQSVEWVDNQSWVPESNKLAVANLLWTIANTSQDSKVSIRHWKTIDEAKPKTPVDLVHIDADPSPQSLRSYLDFAKSLSPKWITGLGMNFEPIAEVVEVFCLENGWSFQNIEMNTGCFLIVVV